MTPKPIVLNWKRNLWIAWFCCFLTGMAFSLVMPFLPLYLERLGVSSQKTLNLWLGVVLSITFIFAAIAAPFWGLLADRKGRKLMLLRSSLCLSIVMMLTGFAQNIWHVLLLRALLGIFGGFVPNAHALIAMQVPRQHSGWALGTLSTGTVTGALIGPLIGGILAYLYGIQIVFCITSLVLFITFLITVLFIREHFTPIKKHEMLSSSELLGALTQPRLVVSMFITTLIIQMVNSSLSSILTMYVRELVANTYNLAVVSGLMAAIPSLAALISAPQLGKLGDRIGKEKILITMMALSIILLITMSFVQTPWQLGILRFMLGATESTLLPTVHTLLISNIESKFFSRIFSYNQSFRELGNVSGPLISALVSANYGFRTVFIVTALLVMGNVIYLLIVDLY